MKISIFLIIFLLYEVRNEEDYSSNFTNKYLQDIMKACVVSTDKQITVIADSISDYRINTITEWETPYILIQTKKNLVNKKYSESADNLNLVFQISSPMIVLFLSSKENFIRLFSQGDDSDKRRKLLQHIYLFVDDFGVDDLKQIPHFEDLNLIFIRMKTVVNQRPSLEITTHGTEIIYFAKLRHNMQKILKNVAISWRSKHFTLNHKKLIIPVRNDQGYVTLESLSNESIVLTGGYLSNMIRILQRKFDLRMSFYIPPVDFPTMKINNTWSGILGRFHRQEADMGFCPIVMSDSRIDATDFGRPYTVDTIPILSIVPDFKPKTSIIFRSYEKKCWLIIFIFTIITATMLTIIIQIKLRIFCERNSRSSDKFTSILWKLFGMLVLQDIDLQRFIRPLPLILVLWSAIAHVLTSGYQGQLYSLMSFPVLETPINTIYEMEHRLTEGTAEYISYRKDFFVQYMKNSKKIVYEKISKNLKMKKELLNYETPEEVIEALQGNRVTIIRSKEVVFSIAKEINKSIDLLYFSKEVPFYVLLALHFRPTFPFRKELDSTIQQMHEGGLFQKWKQDEFDESIRSKQIATPFVRLEDIQGAFMVYIIGISVSVIVFILEILLKKTHLRLPSINCWNRN